LAGAGAALAAEACAAGIADGGMSFIAGAFAAGAAGLAAAAAGASAAAGLASSSAMIRRIDARISSIEGSWTFAGCVISDSASSQRPCMRFTPSKTGFTGSGYAGRDFHRTSLTCPQIKHRATHRAGSRPAQGTEASRPGYKIRRESLCCLWQRYGMATIDCKQTQAPDSPSKPLGEWTAQPATS
jgi:hypothetical protein